MYARGHIMAGFFTAAAVGVILSPDTAISSAAWRAGICAAGSLITSQLPDIDTPNSKIAQIVPIMKILTNIVVLTLELAAMCILVWALQMSKIERSDSIYRLLIILSCCWIIQIWLRHNNEHRGATHTIFFNGLLSALILSPYFAGYQNIYYFTAAIGMITGLFSHLIFDTITIQGCPLFAPFYKENIHWLRALKIRSGKDDIYGVGFSILVMCIVVFTKVRI